VTAFAKAEVYESMEQREAKYAKNRWDAWPRLRTDRFCLRERPTTLKSPTAYASDSGSDWTLFDAGVLVEERLDTATGIIAAPYATNPCYQRVFEGYLKSIRQSFRSFAVAIAVCLTIPALASAYTLRGTNKNSTTGTSLSLNAVSGTQIGDALIALLYYQHGRQQPQLG
jgi:hypothetical protein